MSNITYGIILIGMGLFFITDSPSSVAAWVLAAFVIFIGIGVMTCNPDNDGE